jgi:hypothetical protein
MSTSNRISLDTDTILLRRIYAFQGLGNLPVESDNILTTGSNGTATFVSPFIALSNSDLSHTKYLPSTISTIYGVYSSISGGVSVVDFADLSNRTTTDISNLSTYVNTLSTNIGTDLSNLSISGSIDQVQLSSAISTVNSSISSLSGQVNGDISALSTSVFTYINTNQPGFLYSSIFNTYSTNNAFNVTSISQDLTDLSNFVTGMSNANNTSFSVLSGAVVNLSTAFSVATGGFSDISYFSTIVFSNIFGLSTNTFSSIFGLSTNTFSSIFGLSTNTFSSIFGLSTNTFSTITDLSYKTFSSIASTTTGIYTHPTFSNAGYITGPFAVNSNAVPAAQSAFTVNAGQAAPALQVNISTNRVGINTSSVDPAFTLDVNGPGKFRGNVDISNDLIIRGNDFSLGRNGERGGYSGNALALIKGPGAQLIVNYDSDFYGGTYITGATTATFLQLSNTIEARASTLLFVPSSPAADAFKVELTATNCIINRDSSNNTQIFNNGGSSLKIGVTNNALGMTVSPAANVGIGIDSPAYKLDVCGNMRTQEINVTKNATGLVKSYIGGSLNEYGLIELNGILSIYTPGTSFISANQVISLNAEPGQSSYISNGGRFGIGTKTPEAGFRLDVNGGAKFRGTVNISNDLIIGGNDIALGKNGERGGYNGNALALVKGPGAQLIVNNDSDFYGGTYITGATTATFLQLSNTIDARASTLLFVPSLPAAADAFKVELTTTNCIINRDGANNTQIYNNGGSSLKIGVTNSASGITVDPSANVGINTSAPAYRFDVSGTGRILSTLYLGDETSQNPGTIAFGGVNGDATFSHCTMGTRLYGSPESSEFIIFKGNDISGSFGPDRIRMRAGNIVFDTYPSASSDLSSENIRMTINQDGNVGIATTNPTYTLDVSGNARILGPLLSRVPISTGETEALIIGNYNFRSNNSGSFTLPSAFDGDIIVIRNTGTLSFTVNGVTVLAGTTETFVWVGAVWFNL